MINLILNAGKPVALTIALSAALLIAHTQPIQWGMLRFDPPAGWSEQTTKDRITFSNYASGENAQVSITLLQPFSYEAKPDTAFAFEWRQLFQSTDRATIPRARKLYTENGDLFYLGGGEVATSHGSKYFQLAVFVKDGFAQAVSIEYDDIKAWKTQQYEYIEKLQRVEVSGKKEG